MKALLAALTRLINYVLDRQETQERDNKQREHQKHADAVQANPSDWFMGHFNGVRDDQQGNAGKTSKADTKRNAP